MLSATFELFEFICTELNGRDSCIITNEDLGAETEEQTGGRIDDILDNLRSEYSAANNQSAISAALNALKRHFELRHSLLPFSYQLAIREFRSVDADYIKFIADVAARRSSGGEYAKEFENATCRRIATKVTGVLHNVGYPRKDLTTAGKFKRYLRTLGFDNRVILGDERDGGLDILWLLPFGANPVAPVISLQCKNGLFSRSVAREATSRTAETLLCHRMLRGNGVHLTAIVFNDYIEPARLPNKPITYVPLGLSDLAAVGSTDVIEI